MKKNFALLIMSLAFASCNVEKKDAVASTSPDGTLRITVSGKRSDPVSPWMVNLVIKGKELNGNISFEFYGSDLTEETIQFSWEGNEKCTVTFKEKDGTQRVFEFTPQGNEVHWKELTAP